MSDDEAFERFLGSNLVSITVAQLKAYRAAAKVLPPLLSSGIWGSALSWLVAGAEAAGVKATGIKVAKGFVRIQCRAEEALAALRAAGIDLEDKT